MKLRTRNPSLRRGGGLAAAAVSVAAILSLAPPAALASTGGTGTTPTATGSDAKLLPSGEAVSPSGAPQRVVRAIEFANRIRKKPYKYGGGHSSWKIDSGYDCSGAVSYMLHGAKMLSSPLPSGPLAKWGDKGPGEWISVYAHGGHAFAVVAGLRWDTSGGKGPRWHEDMRSSSGFRVRHYPGY